MMVQPASSTVMKPISISHPGAGNAVPSRRCEFFKASEIFHSDVSSSVWKPPAKVASPQHRRDEFQPVIPWQVALQQSLPPLHRLHPLCRNGDRLANCNLLPWVNLRPGTAATRFSLLMEFPTRCLRVSFLCLTRAVVVIDGMTNNLGMTKQKGNRLRLIG
jgi:hypothetical protein